MYKKYILFLLILLSGSLLAQNSDLPTGEVDVIDEFEARLIDAERFVVNPQLPALDTNRRFMSYDIINKALQVQYLPPSIQPRRVSPPPMSPIYNGFARVGAGLPQALYLDAAYDFFDEKSPVNVGIDLFHNSANNNKKVENQKFSHSKAQLNATYLNDFGFAVDGQVGYLNDVVHFYGYNDLDDDFDTELTYDEDDVKQTFSNLYFKGRLYNTTPTVSNIDYRAGIDFYTLQDNYAARETGYVISGGLTKWLQDKHPIKLDLVLDFTNYQDTATQNLNNFFLQPSYAYHGEQFKVQVGMNLASHEDEFYFFPDIEVSANVLENLLTAFAGAEGGLYKNNFRNLTDYNPFLVSRIQVENSFVNKYYGGIKGEFLGFDYRAEVSYEDVENLALFVKNQDSIPRFEVLYDTASIITLAAQVTAPLFEGLDIRGGFAQRVYSLEGQDKPWHLPSLTLNAGLRYRLLDDKLSLQGDIFIENGVPVPTSDGSKNLNALLDISGSAEYMFTENIGGFVRVNNLLNNRRQRWQHYPILGLNGTVGLSARF